MPPPPDRLVLLHLSDLHFGDHSLGEAKRYLASRGIEVRG